MDYIEHEIKIVYREQVNMGRKIYLPYEVSCEGRYSGYGSTLEEAIKEFDRNNMEDLIMDAIYLKDIIETIGKWIDADFDMEVPIRVVRLLEEAYKVSVNELDN